MGFRGFLLHALIVIGYGALMCGAKRGQTVGMMPMGTRAIDEAGGGTIGFGRALGRAAFEYLLVVFLFVPGTGTTAQKGKASLNDLHVGH